MKYALIMVYEGHPRYFDMLLVHVVHVALEAELFQCDMDEMDEKLAGCLEDMDMRVKTLEQAVLSGEGN